MLILEKNYMEPSVKAVRRKNQFQAQLNGIANSVQNGAAGFTNFKLEVFLSY
jgi:hypothetical protein